MTDKRCFIQFPHPGGEHKPDRNGKIGWNKRCRPHKRKFMRLRGEWIDGSGNRHCDDLLAWGEWEPESDLIRDFKTPDGEPHHPRYLWDPYWVPRNTYRCLHNTDPFIFGDRFLYSNCSQSAPNKCGLKHLDQGSVIAFGSGKKIKDHCTWMLDTVLVVRDSFWYNPLNPRKALEGKVPDEFLEVTGSPLVAWAEDLRKGSGSTACAPTSEQLRLYRGATPDDPVDGMFSFFPAIPADGESCFPRPVVFLDDEYFNPRSLRAPKGAGCNRKSDELGCQWRSLVKQVHRAGLVLGTCAQLPERRVE